MAKLRVYELARELNMDNKTLLGKMQEMHIDAKSHMTALDDDTINRIKKGVFGPKEKEALVEDKRILPNVIRRRKKIVPAEPERVEAEKIPAAAKGEEPVEPVEPVDLGETPEPAELKATPEPSVEPPEAEVNKETPESIEAEKNRLETGQPEPAAFALTEAQTAPEAISPDLKKGEPEEKPADAKKPPKKAKKGFPAKIISLPEAPVEPPEPAVQKIQKPVIPEPAEDKDKKAEKKKPFEAYPKKFVGIEPEEDADSAAGRKNRKKKPLEPEKGRKVGKIKVALRRKEVIEGDALYDQTFGRGRKAQKKHKQQAAPVEQKTLITTPKAIKRRIRIDDTIVLSDLAKRMGIKSSEIIGKLMGMGVMVTVNQTIDFETSSLVAAEFGFEVENAAFEESAVFKTEKDDPAQLVHRPPVVTIMGHVDHGKTSLLDVIRRTKVTELEAGGITQHIGAYHVQLDRGDIVFLDTPGHEAFTAMRARGALVTDIVILVVAADDGVMPQTVEAINHAKAANVPILVAVNKIDKDGADPERIKRELAEKGLVPEEWGGDTIFANVSAKKQIGIDNLLEMILLQAEVLELKANPNKYAKGYIIESKLDTGRGAVATVLIQEGTLHVGDPVVCGMFYGKIRMMFNDRGIQLKEAGPSMPVEIVGLSGVPMAGEEIIALADEKDAKQISEHRLQKQRAKVLAGTSRLSLEKLYERMKEGVVKDLNLVIKADVQGSIEALKESLLKLSTGEVKINIIHAAVGPINESDISLAAVSNAIILGFHVRPSAKLAGFAEETHVDIRYYDVIYNAIKDIQDAMVGMMDSKFEERVLGQAEVRQTFTVPNIGTIAGSYVTSGKIQRNASARVIRDGIVNYNGRIDSLKRFKDDAKEVLAGYECGIHIENYNDIKVGDIIECYYLEEIKPVVS
jgi:translation initiation factor IF-2